MTLCMVAACYVLETETYRIVFGADSRAETAWAGGNVAFKFTYLTDDWAALLAGEFSKAQDFLATCREVMEDYEPLTRDNIIDTFNNVSCAHKEKLCRRYVRQQLGIDFDRFLTQGEDELPADVRARVFHQLGELEFGCEVLIFGFTRRTGSDGELRTDPQIIEIDRYGEVSSHQNFAAVGTGSVIAKSTLYQREQSAFLPLERTLYHLYEAARLATKSAPGVGKIDYFLVVDPVLDDEGGLHLAIANKKCLDVMAATYQAIGPRPAIPIEKFDDSYFEPVDKKEGEETNQPSDSQT
jgi:hypothetical protein